MAAWVLCFVFKWFLASEIILLVVFVLALSCYATLFYYPATKHRPIEFLFAHVPIRMLVVILLQVDIWQNGLLALGYERPSDAGGKPHWEREHSFHNVRTLVQASEVTLTLLALQWIMFGIILGVAVIQSIVVFAQKDVVWCAASTYLAVALALQPEGKSPQIFIAIVLSAVAVCCALVSSIGVPVAVRVLQLCKRLTQCCAYRLVSHQVGQRRSYQARRWRRATRGGSLKQSLHRSFYHDTRHPPVFYVPRLQSKSSVYR